jgi:hypothetical protein
MDGSKEPSPLVRSTEVVGRAEEDQKCGDRHSTEAQAQDVCQTAGAIPGRFWSESKYATPADDQDLDKETSLVIGRVARVAPYFFFLSATAACQ